MTRDGTPASECEIHALSQLLSLRILIHTPARVIHYGPPTSPSTVYLKYYGNHRQVGHYEPWHPAFCKPASYKDAVLTKKPGPAAPPRASSNYPTRPAQQKQNTCAAPRRNPPRLTRRVDHSIRPRSSFRLNPHAVPYAYVSRSARPRKEEEGLVISNLPSFEHANRFAALHSQNPDYILNRNTDEITCRPSARPKRHVRFAPSVRNGQHTENPRPKPRLTPLPAGRNSLFPPPGHSDESSRRPPPHSPDPPQPPTQHAEVAQELQVVNIPDASSPKQAEPSPIVASIPQVFTPPRLQWKIEIEIFGHFPVHALLDTGSTYSLIDAELIPHSHLIDKTQPTPQLRTAKGDLVNILGTTQANVSYAGQGIQHTFYVCENLAHHLILGLSWFYATKSVLDFTGDQYTLALPSGSRQQYNLDPPPPFAEPITNHALGIFQDIEIPEIYSSNRKIFATKTQLLPALSHAFIPFTISPLPLTKPSLLSLTKHLEEQLQASNVRLFMAPNCKSLLLFNASEDDVLISKEQLLGKFDSNDNDVNVVLADAFSQPDPPSLDGNRPGPDRATASLRPAPPGQSPPAAERRDAGQPRAEPSRAAPRQAPQSFHAACITQEHNIELSLPDDPSEPAPNPEQFFQVYEGLPDDQKQKLRALLTEYKDVFATTLADIREPCTYTASLPLRNDATVKYTPQYKLSETELQFAIKYVQKLEDAKIVVRQRSNHNHPIFLLLKRKEKPDDPDDYRFIINLKNLNSCLKRSNFALPSTTELISRVAGKAIIWRADAFSGYYQIALTRESSRLCAFTLNSTSYCLARLPMGGSLSQTIFLPNPFRNIRRRAQIAKSQHLR